jgi:DNA-binding PadR family transcriptional regulator
MIPFERSVLEAGVELHSAGTQEFHGYLLAKHLKDAEAARKLVGYGTLYKALDRLATAGLVESRWESPDDAATENRPRRRLYRVTGEGRKALANSVEASPQALVFKQEPAS